MAAAYMSIDRGRNIWYIYTIEYYSAIKKNEIMPSAATWMDLAVIILSEGSQTEKDKYRRISLICGIRLKCLPLMQETWVRSLGQEDPLEKEMATHPSILAWRIPWTEEPRGLQSIGSQRVRHD